MRYFLKCLFVFVLLSSGLLAANELFHPHTAQSFRVGVGRQNLPSGTHVLASSASGGTVTITRASTVINADGSQQITLVYTNANNQTVHIRTLSIDATCTRVTDSLGNIVSATGPTAECTAASSFTTTEDTTISNAATGGKLNL